MLNIPDYFFEVKYNGSHYPGAEATNGLEGGANCQVFAYEILSHFGIQIPDFRSSELWEDTDFTKKVVGLEPLDILLWNKEKEAWGAHVGLYLGDNLAIHLSKSNEYPVIWTLEKFLEQDLYQVFIGAKRVLKK